MRTLRLSSIAILVVASLLPGCKAKEKSAKRIAEAVNTAVPQRCGPAACINRCEAYSMGADIKVTCRIADSSQGEAVRATLVLECGQIQKAGFTGIQVELVDQETVAFEFWKATEVASGNCSFQPGV